MRDVSTYRSIWSYRTPRQLQQLADIKRALERWAGDRRFRERLQHHAEDPRPVAEAYGLGLDLRLLRPLFETDESTSGGAQSPQVVLWHDYRRDLLGFRELVRRRGDTAEQHPQFNAWRERQIRRVDSECPHPEGIVHPVVAFELADGCSVGCWFCGISAERFAGHWPYTDENAALWRGILEVMVDELGPAVQTGFLYWATEPFDNPDYHHFLEDFAAVTGYLPQTTSAVPLRDLALTRRVMTLFDRYQQVCNRFSILSPKILDRVHATFSAQQLLGVELVPQMRGSILSKTAAGRARTRAGDTGGQESVADHQVPLTSTTIACVTGFLINMVRGSIQLISPTRSSDRWPKGYKVWAERGFTSASSFADAARNLIEKAAATPRPDQTVAFRSDLRFEERDRGFELVSAIRSHRIRGGRWTRALGRRIASGGDTYRSLHRSLVQAGADLLALSTTLDELYAAGLLLEAIDLEPPTRGLQLPVVRTLPEGGEPVTSCPV